MSTIRYNGISIQDVLTQSIDQTIEYDSTGVDPLFMKITVNVLGVVHTTSNANLGVFAGTPIGHAAISILQRRLMEPRKRFQFFIGSSSYLDVTPASHPPGEAFAPRVALRNLDVNAGPKPKVRVVKIISDTSLRIEFSVELAIPNCDHIPQSQYPGGYLNLRFWVADEMNGEDWLTTRTYQGKLRLTASMATPHYFRPLVVPPLQPGFRRDKIILQGSPDGFELDFTIIDKENFAAPPFPATHWTMNHRIASPQPGGAIMTSEVSLELKGPKSVPQRELMVLAVRIMDAKIHLIENLRIRGDQREPNAILENAAFDIASHANIVRGQATIKHLREGIGLINHVIDTIGLSLPPNVSTRSGTYHPEINPFLKPTATVAGLFYSRLQTSCDPATMPQFIDQPAEDINARRGDGKQEDPKEYRINGYENRYSQEHKQASYIYYRSESEITQDSGEISLPIAKSSNSRSSNTAAFIRLFNGHAHRSISVIGERINAPPQLPEPVTFRDSNGIEHRMLDFNLVANDPILSADGVKTLHSATMEIEYGMSRAPRQGESIRRGTLPYVTPNAVGSRDIPYLAFISPTAENAIN